MATRTHTIESSEDLKATWVDTRCPNMSFSFIEQSFDECLQEDGTYRATYETLEILAGESFSMTYLCEETGGTKTYTLTEGEYGIKPN
jgi:hypothetical protein